MNTGTDVKKTRKLTGRKAVKAFFDFHYRDLPPPAKINFKYLGIAVVVGLLFGLIMRAAILFGILFGALYLLKVFLWNKFKRNQYDKAISIQRVEHRRLAKESKAIQRQDIVSSILRMVEKAHIDRDELRVLDETFIFESEEDLFAEESLEKKLGDLSNKSIRLISWGKDSSLPNQRFRKLRWGDSSGTEALFNPIRIVTLYLTGTELIVCDACIDSVSQSDTDDHEHVPLNKITKVKGSSRSLNNVMAASEIFDAARDLGFKDAQIEALKASLNNDNHDGEVDDGEWVTRDSFSFLNVSIPGSETLVMPIRNVRFFGPHSETSDHTLTDDERIEARMINELTRLIRDSR